MTRSFALLLVMATLSTARADEREPETAAALAGFGTAGAVALVVSISGLHGEDWKTALPVFALAEVLPSAGKIYAGDVASPGLVARLVGGALIVLALNDPFETPETFLFSQQAGAALGIGALLTIGGTVYDLATSAQSARRYNAEHVRLVPTLSTESTGVSLLGSF